MNAKLITFFLSSHVAMNAFAQNTHSLKGQSPLKQAFDEAERKAQPLVECKSKLENVIRSFQKLEQAVFKKTMAKSNISLLLPWISDYGWKDLEGNNAIEITSISKTSAALVKADVKDPNISTAYTRFEDFKSRPIVDADTGVFQVEQVISEICTSEKTLAPGMIRGITPLSSSGFWYDGYKFDIVAQASLFQRYLKEASEKITQAGKLEDYSSELIDIQESVTDLKEFAVEKRNANIL